MALATDQQAMLKLLLERGQGYPELAVLLGIEEEEVRRRARRALAELGGADPDREAGLTDYLLGQADPIDRADAVRHLRESPEDHRLAGEIAERLRELYPEAELPRLPGEPRQGRLVRRARAIASEALPQAAAPRRLGGLRPSQTRTIVILASSAVLLIAVVLAVSGVFAGGEEDPAAEAAADTSAAADERAVPVQLQPVQGSDAGGVVVFGFATGDQPYIEFQIRRLDPPANDRAYVLWFLTGPNEGFPLPAPLPVQPNGTIDERIPVPAETLGVIQQADTIAIALNDAQKLSGSIQRAVEDRSAAVRFPGGTVLSAPITGAAGEAAGPAGG